MIDVVLEELAEVAHWQDLLAAYCRRQSAAKALDPEHAGWVPRIASLGEIGGEPLSQLHGRLIALGLLKFELEGRTSGMSYQVSSLGLRALAGPTAVDAEEVEVDAAPEADDDPSLAA